MLQKGGIFHLLSGNDRPFGPVLLKTMSISLFDLYSWWPVCFYYPPSIECLSQNNSLVNFGLYILAQMYRKLLPLLLEFSYFENWKLQFSSVLMMFDAIYIVFCRIVTSIIDSWNKPCLHDMQDEAIEYPKWNTGHPKIRLDFWK